MQLRNKRSDPPGATKSRQHKKARKTVATKQGNKNKQECVSQVADILLDKQQCEMLQEQVKEYLLRKLCQTRLTSWDDQEFSSLSKTIESLVRNPAPQGESIILIGPAGSGKKKLVEEIVQKMKSESQTQRLKVIQLYGTFHAHGEGPMRETHLQLKNSMTNTEVNQSTTEADFLEDTANDSSTKYIFLLYDFEYFVREKNQSFLYRIFEFFQRNKTSGLVLATSQQHDLVDSLEKRIKSRFSHRVYYMPTFKDTRQVQKILQSIFSIDADAPSSILAVKQPFNQEMSQLFGNTTWNLALEELLKFTPNVSSFLRFAFYTITTMSLDKFGIPKFDLDIVRHGSRQLRQSAGRMEMLKNLSVLEVALLAALCRLTCRQLEKSEKGQSCAKPVAFSFERIYQEYIKQELNSDSTPITADSYKRPIAWKAFSRLLDIQLIRFPERRGEGRNAMELQPVILVISPEELSQVLKEHPYISLAMQRWNQHRKE